MNDDLLAEDGESASSSSEQSTEEPILIEGPCRAQEETRGGRIAVLIPPPGRYLMIVQFLVTTIYFLFEATFREYDDLIVGIDFTLPGFFFFCVFCCLGTQHAFNAQFVIAFAVVSILLVLPVVCDVFKKESEGRYLMWAVCLGFMYLLACFAAITPCLFGLQLGDGSGYVFGTSFRMLYLSSILGRLIGDFLGWNLSDNLLAVVIIIAVLSLLLCATIFGARGKLEKKFPSERPGMMNAGTFFRFTAMQPIVCLGISTLYYGIAIVEDDTEWQDKRWMMWIANGCSIIAIPLFEKYLFSSISDHHFLSKPGGRLPFSIFLIAVLCIISGTLIIARSGSLLPVTIPLYLILSVAEYLFVSATWESLFRFTPPTKALGAFRGFLVFMVLGSIPRFMSDVNRNTFPFLFFSIGVCLFGVSFYQAGHVYESVIDRLGEE